MKNRFFTISLLMVLLVSLTGTAQARAIPARDPAALVYVHIDTANDLARFAATRLPMYSRLDSGLLAGADLSGQQALRDAGLTIQVLEPDLSSGHYYLASSHSSQPVPDFAAYGQVLLKTGSTVLLRMEPAQADALAQAGAELQAVTLIPKPLVVQGEPAAPVVVQPDPVIQGMIDQVTETQVYTYDRQLAGELPVWVDGGWYTIPTRYTYSGTPIQKTTHFVGQHLQDLGMNVEYHIWNSSNNPNVVGEITGTTHPNDIYIIGGHLDDVQGAPGADDNASGSVATLLAADILSQFQWGCTLRFAFWTGEEQGLLGSAAYAQRAYQQGDNILGYLNLDMLAWNTLNSPPYINLFYSTSIPASYQLALLYQDVIGSYDINLLTRLGANLWGSDHNSFWDYGFNSILAIEDDIGNDFNPYYHSPQDTPAHTDPAYFTNFVKASVGTFAHMTGCLIPRQGHLDGHVTAAGAGTPIISAQVTAYNSLGGASNPIFTDLSGYYTMTLPVDTYTVTVSADGYVPAEIGGVQVISGTTTTRDFALQPVCAPVGGLDFSWTPLEPFNGELAIFSATANGSLPIDFQWDFGDGITGTGETITHTFALANTYTVNVSATNGCGTGAVTHNLTVLQRISAFFLPLVSK